MQQKLGNNMKIIRHYMIIFDFYMIFLIKLRDFPITIFLIVSGFYFLNRFQTLQEHVRKMQGKHIRTYRTNVGAYKKIMGKYIGTRKITGKHRKHIGNYRSNTGKCKNTGTPGSMNSLFSEFFKKFGGVFLEVFEIFRVDFGRFRLEK